MNEREVARFVRKALDESTERLFRRETQRLAAARADALAHATVSLRPTPCGKAAETGRMAGAAGARMRAHARAPSLGWRIAAIVAPIAVVTAGLLGISAWQTQQRADDLAALDAAMLVDEVPISAYADRGFGVFLRNVSTEPSQE